MSDISRASSPSSGPGATAVRSACSSTWSSGCGQHRVERRHDLARHRCAPRHARGGTGLGRALLGRRRRSSARPWVESAPSPVTPMRSASSGVAVDDGRPERGVAPRPAPRAAARAATGARATGPAAERDELVEQRPPSLRRERAVEVARERVDARSRVVAPGHEHGRARHEQPRLREHRPALGGRPHRATRRTPASGTRPRRPRRRRREALRRKRSRRRARRPPRRRRAAAPCGRGRAPRARRCAAPTAARSTTTRAGPRRAARTRTPAAPRCGRRGRGARSV